MKLMACLLQVCQKRRPYSKNGKGYPTCGLTCARILEDSNGTTSLSTPGIPQFPQNEEIDGAQEALCIVRPKSLPFSDFCSNAGVYLGMPGTPEI